jgi:hypothetical protein
MGSCSWAIIAPSPLNKGQATFYDVDFMQEGISLCPRKGLKPVLGGYHFLKIPTSSGFHKGSKTGSSSYEELIPKKFELK